MRGKALAAVLTIGLTGAAFAATYETGLYKTGNPKTGAGVRMQVKTGSFNVSIIRYRETCKYGSKVIHDFITFKAGTKAKLQGKIRSSGAFSARYESGGNVFLVSGTIAGTRATIKSSEQGPYNIASTTHPNQCSGSATFHAAVG